MPNKDKGGNILFFFSFFFLFLEDKLGKCKQGMLEIGNKQAKKTRYAIPTLLGNWRT